MIGSSKKVPTHCYATEYDKIRYLVKLHLLEQCSMHSAVDIAGCFSNIASKT